LLIRIGRGSILELTTRASPRCEQPAITASLPPPWYVHLGTTRSVALGADDAGLAMAALAGIVAARHIEVLAVTAVTAATAAAKVRFNFPPGADQCRLPSKAATMTSRNPVSGTR
jgi:hypothetical protein